MELMLAVLIVIFVLSGLLLTYIATFGLIETTKNITLASNGAQKKMEEIRDHTFTDIYSYYNGSTFIVDGFGSGDSKGNVKVEVQQGTISNPILLKVTVTVCWRQRAGRVIGEDKNLNGVLDPGEDENSNGQIDSPVQLVTLMAQR